MPELVNALGAIFRVFNWLCMILLAIGALLAVSGGALAPIAPILTPMGLICLGLYLKRKTPEFKFVYVFGGVVIFSALLTIMMTSIPAPDPGIKLTPAEIFFSSILSTALFTGLGYAIAILIKRVKN